MAKLDRSLMEIRPELMWALFVVHAFLETGGQGFSFFLDDKFIGITNLLCFGLLAWWAYKRAMSSGEEKYQRLTRSAAFFVISFALVALWQNRWIYLLVICGGFAYHCTFRDPVTPAERVPTGKR